MNPCDLSDRVEREGDRGGQVAASGITGKAVVKQVPVTLTSLMRQRAGVLTASLLLLMLNRAAGLVLPYSTKYLVDNVIIQHSQSALALVVIALVVATAFQALTSFVVTRTMLLSSHKLVNELRKRIYDHVLRLPIAYFDSSKTGILLSRVMQDAEGVRNLIGSGLLDLAGALLTSIFAFIVLIRISPFITLLVSLVLVVFALLMKWGASKYNPYFKEQASIRAELMGRLSESLNGIRVVKTYRAEKHESAHFSSLLDHLLTKTLVTSVSAAALSMAVAVVTGVLGATVMYLGAKAVISAHMTLGDLFRYTMFLGVLVAPLIQIVSISTRLGEAAAGIERIQQMLTEQVEEEDQSGTTILKDIRGDIRFEKVGFAYQKDNQTLHDIVLHARPGTLTALVGPSGGGKSTIISLIARFYRQTSGTIWIDDVDLSKVELGSYRSHLGIVLQDPFLFGGTLRENISLGCPNAPLSKIQEACRIAHADEFIERLPDGYETIIGERGVKLSAGQRQRLAIARAVMADPKILILDEATSSLDFESEAIVQDALANLLCNRTTFVVAHRLSTIRQADQILVVENGHVVERGTHDVLYEQRGRYWDLYQKQRGLDKNLFLAPDETAEQIESPRHVAGDN